jgi:hypothetical protein
LIIIWTKGKLAIVVIRESTKKNFVIIESTQKNFFDSFVDIFLGEDKPDSFIPGFISFNVALRPEFEQLIFLVKILVDLKVF